MFKRFFWPSSDRLLLGQLHLLYRNIVSSTIPAVVLSLALAIALMNDNNRSELLLWCGSVIAAKLFTCIYARRQLAADIDTGQAGLQMGWLSLMNAVYGASWGALAWVTLDRSDTVSNLLMLAVIAGVLGNVMAVLSPVIVVFVAFMLALSAVTAAHLWWSRELVYSLFLVPAFLYLISLLAQACNSAAAARAAIALGFKNEDLVQQANAARLEAEQANQIKSKFLAAAGHDLRQPVHAQGLFLGILAATELSDYQGQLLANARLASRSFSEMLSSLLDFSRIEAGVLRTHPKPFRLQTLLNKIENDLAPLADAKNIVYRSRDTTAVVNSDAALVEIVLRNLVSNAISYTDSGGLLVACRQRGEQWLVEVWDTGIGIEPSQQQSIFREFHQLGNTERDRRKGLGLGLPVAQGLASVLGHQLWLSSRPGRGSVFRLALPLANASVLQAEAAPVYPAHYLSGLHVLLIDDEEAVRFGSTDLLRSWGCTVDAAESLAEALPLAQRRRPGMVISDYRLRAQQTGGQAIAALRAVLGEDLPALLITGDTAPERLREALASGVPLLHKPVSSEDLFQALAALVASHKSSRLERQTWL